MPSSGLAYMWYVDIYMQAEYPYMFLKMSNIANIQENISVNHTGWLHSTLTCREGHEGKATGQEKPAWGGRVHGPDS